MNEYYFCESVAAATGPWHIRPKGLKGMKTTGGADTKSLCGRDMGWDIPVPITSSTLRVACRSCAEAYVNRQ